MAKYNIILMAYEKGFRCTKDGYFLNKKGVKIGALNKDGYLKSTLRISKTKCTPFLCHRLQAYQKYGHDLFKKGMVVRHLNGIKTDNSWDNIAIGTNLDNARDIPKHITVRRSLYATSFVRKHNKEEIKKYHNTGKLYKETMDKFNISSKGTLHFILNN